MISSSQGKKKFQLSSCLLFFSLLDLLARSLRDNVLGAVGGSQTCICALTWALEVMLVPLTFFILHFPSLYQIHFCICCNFPPPPPAKQIMHQPMELSEFKVLELFFSSFVCAPFVLMKPEEQITRSEDTDDTGFWKCDLNR